MLGYRLRLKRDGTRAETRFRLSPKRTSPFKSTGASIKSTASSRGVRISGSNAGYTTFRGSARVLATHSIRQFFLHFPSPFVTVCHQVSKAIYLYWLSCFFLQWKQKVFPVRYGLNFYVWFIWKPILNVLNWKKNNVETLCKSIENLTAWLQMIGLLWEFWRSFLVTSFSLPSQIPYKCLMKRTHFYWNQTWDKKNTKNLNCLLECLDHSHPWRPSWIL